MFEFDKVEFDAENPEPRCPCILLVDTSLSMEGQRIKQLNRGLKTFKESLVKDDLASARVEVCIITFGSHGVKVAKDFITADQFNPPRLSARSSWRNQGTPMGAGISRALEELEKRKTIYKNSGVSYYRPWLFMITDGEPTDHWQGAAQSIEGVETNKSVAFFAVGVEEANMNILSHISLRDPIKLKGLDFQELFVWLSQSLTNVSHSTVGTIVPLQPPTLWGTIVNRLGI